MSNDAFWAELMANTPPPTRGAKKLAKLMGGFIRDALDRPSMTRQIFDPECGRPLAPGDNAEKNET